MYSVCKQVYVFSNCCMRYKYILLKWLCLGYHLQNPVIMKDQGTDVCFALYIYVHAGSAKCICLELSEYFTLLIRTHRQQTQDTGGLPPHQPGRWQKGDATAWLPVRLCLPGHIAFQKVTPAFILWSQSWQSTNLPRLLHTSHALLSCLVDAGG